uniref:Leukocyte receptor tyrosine kinase n=1 Tax=Myotis myotis TaxID=51298 RepID=A0A7J8ANH9_MYOMY|nr:leukocyte receptor tyrosine kinase [Myotis myotis]
MGHAGVLVKYLLAMNSPQIPARSGFQREYAGLTKAPQDLPPSLNIWHDSLFQGPGLELNMWLAKAGVCPPHPTPPHPPPPRNNSYFLIVTGNHGEVESQLHLNYSHCLLKDCQWQAEFWLVTCMCSEGMELAVNNSTCMGMFCHCPRSGFLGPQAGRRSRILSVGRRLEMHQCMLCLQGACSLVV